MGMQHYHHRHHRDAACFQLRSGVRGSVCMGASERNKTDTSRISSEKCIFRITAFGGMHQGKEEDMKLYCVPPLFCRWVRDSAKISHSTSVTSPTTQPTSLRHHTAPRHATVCVCMYVCVKDCSVASVPQVLHLSLSLPLPLSIHLLVSVLSSWSVSLISGKE